MPEPPEEPELSEDSEPPEPEESADEPEPQPAAATECGELVAVGDLTEPPDPDAPPDPEEPEEPAGPPVGLVIDPFVNLDGFLPKSTLYVHMSLEQYLRQTRGAARVEGLGPLTIEAAVDLLMHTRVTITPVIDLHQTWAVDGYQTPPRIREHVELRYPVEVFPHGTATSRHADKDHTTPYRAGAPPGQTSTDNLAPLSRRHHRVKTHGTGWIHRQPLPGVHYWRTPHGHWARVDHRGTHNLGRHLDPAHRTLLDPNATPTEHALAALLTE